MAEVTILRMGAVLAMFLLPAGGAAAQTATAVNASRPTTCAEEDNVYIRLEGAAIRHFEVAARHPPYLAALTTDNLEADFTTCDMSGDPRVAAAPTRVTLYRDAEWQLVGLAYDSFWRPADVPVRVGGRVTNGLHLLQLFRTIDGTRIEVLVVYPPDGYWRAKPLPPPHFVETGYGSSFLVGPVEQDGRPLVAFSSLEYEPAGQTFRLRFRAGGAGSLRVVHAGRDETRVAVGLDSGTPVFAALRSMYVAEDNNDVAEASWRGQSGAPVSIMAPLSVVAPEFRFGRARPSRHNTSAPDMLFGAFAP